MTQAQLERLRLRAWSIQFANADVHEGETREDALRGIASYIERKEREGDDGE